MKLSVMFFVAGFVIALAGCNAQDVATTHSLEDAVVTRTNNHIDYVEFAAEDLGVAKAFYAAAFGWEFQDWAPTYVSFSGAGVEGGIRGGETPVNGSTPDDLEASEKRVVEAGGEVTDRHEFPGGKRFHFRDPSGNVLGVWTLVEAEA